ncbi:hydrogenase expression/formation protein HypE [Romboutsia maritimum]|uniref:Hydrogenase expression/formation protein HypE n=1 Tax=Romboutsia maritimum TaxID=2020948 RepID=A0A371IRM8_9FIRM|nr:hydrogenase expression/formation protein HypE [Romboutsia maritimum]RDY23138.1 hydrogenase expression/formation protein HypE [Romboutsia maritimum]
MDQITLSHGSGGEETNKLIEELFYKYFNNDILLQKNDSSIIDKINGKIAVTTDSFVINPIFFKGGDIGKLSVCGTINDLAVSGATPLYITVAFIIEEGFLLSDLEKIVKSIGNTAKYAKVKIVAGDTKVVDRGKCDKIYINTTGIGVIKDNDYEPKVIDIKQGDKIIVSGSIGDHGTSIMTQREFFEVDSEIKSDCACLNYLIIDMINASKNIKIMRDPTRGGLANTLKEIVISTNKSMILNEEDIPIKDDVKNFCEMLGLDPLYVANEGKLVCIVSQEESDKVLEAMRKNKLGKDASIIGEVINDINANLYIKTTLGATKILQMAHGELLPRIC